MRGEGGIRTRSGVSLWILAAGWSANRRWGRCRMVPASRPTLDAQLAAAWGTPRHARPRQLLPPKGIPANRPHPQAGTPRRSCPGPHRTANPCQNRQGHPTQHGVPHRNPAVRAAHGAQRSKRCPRRSPRRPARGSTCQARIVRKRRTAVAGTDRRPSVRRRRAGRIGFIQSQGDTPWNALRADGTQSNELARMPCCQPSPPVWQRPSGRHVVPGHAGRCPLYASWPNGHTPARHAGTACVARGVAAIDVGRHKAIRCGTPQMRRICVAATNATNPRQSLGRTVTPSPSVPSPDGLIEGGGDSVCHWHPATVCRRSVVSAAGETPGNC
jgi:hypothetical protein